MRPQVQGSEVHLLWMLTQTGEESLVFTALNFRASSGTTYLQPSTKETAVVRVSSVSPVSCMAAHSVPERRGVPRRCGRGQWMINGEGDCRSAVKKTQKHCSKN